MLSTPEFLSQCYELWKLGFSFTLVPGHRIARGFADVGYEEYSVLNDHQAVSLFAGNTIVLDEFYLNYYFFIPTADQIFNELYSKGWDVEKLIWKNQRTWELTVHLASESEQTMTLSGPTLLSAGVEALIRIARSV